MEDTSGIQQDTSLPKVTPVIDETSQPYVGRWNRLVSTTNWEKGRIICQWRDALVSAEAAPAEYSDEAWSRRVGAVTGQHVGRLRRVYQRFSQTYEDYDGLFWSHFQAALDWEDAEMWLEGAVQSRWSVSIMRRTRWETLGAVEADKPQDDDIVTAELDDDFEPASSEPAKDAPIAGSYEQVHGPPIPEGPDFGDEESATTVTDDPGAAIYSDEDDRETIEFVRPFENLGELPEDLAEAFEAFKLAILRHKTEGWQQISRDDVLGTLDALKALAVAPSDDAAPF